MSESISLDNLHAIGQDSLSHDVSIFYTEVRERMLLTLDPTLLQQSLELAN